MGLTGHILEVEFRLLQISSPWIHAETEQLGDLDSLIERLTVAGTRWPYTVAWIDGLGMRNGRCPAILQKGRWATAAEAHDTRPRSKMSVPVPLSPPSWLLQPSFVRLFNRAYYRAQGRLRTGRIVHPHAFFYPLDTLGDWNRLYGPQGFTQYQCVVPHTAGHDAVRRLFAALDRAGGAPFLCVLKDFQGQGKGTISFPRAGISIAIDMPVRPEKTPAIVNALNDVVAGDGGCVYLAKDAFTRADHYRAMEPRLDAWMDVRRTWDPDGKLRSALSVRLFGDDA
jgi:decaprenylphospho-beta-D-ribofuranose 2-oxidase